METYEAHEIDMGSPLSRAETEKELLQIAEGTISADEVLKRRIQEDKDLYRTVFNLRDKLSKTFN